MRTKQIVYIIVFFISGYIFFALGSFRLGYHAFSWRTDGAARALDRAVSDCFTGDDNDRTKFMVCAQKKLNAGVTRWGLRALMDALVNRLEGQKVGLTQCHDLAHAIGWAGIVDSRSLSTVMPQCTNTCVYGCGHGAMAAWYALGNDIVGKLGTICVEGIDWSGNPQGLQGCFHELGHAIASITGNDMKKSLEYCDKIEEQGRLDCARGVFMELFEPATFATARMPLPSNHPHWCKDLRDPYRGFCFEQAGINEHGYTQDDARAFATCKKVPLDNRDGCFQNLGQNIFYVYQHKQNHMQAAEEFCRATGPAWFNSCMQGILSSSVATQPNVAGGIALCKRLNGQEKRSCTESLTNMIVNKRSIEQQQSILRQIQ